MTESKISEARKKSEDPAQEHLREQKDLWNQSAKTLIAKLIAFKRGLNGRGDPRAGLPPSKIQDPLPPEISGYLDSIASDYVALVDGAEAIIAEQHHYSEVRRKPQPKQAPQSQPMAAADDGLIAEASWFGSRMWASLFGINGKGKEHKVSMLTAANQISKTLEQLENTLTSSNPNAVSSAVNEAGTLGITSVSTLLKSFEALRKLEEKAEGKKPSAGNTPPSTDKSPEAPAAEEPKDEVNKELVGEIGAEEIEKKFLEYRKLFSAISEDVKHSTPVIHAALEKARATIDTNKDSPAVAKEFGKYVKTLETTGAELSNAIFSVSAIVLNTRKTNDPVKLANAIKHIDRVYNMYSLVAHICTGVLEKQVTPETRNAYEIFQFLAREVVAAGVQKEAGVKSFLKKKWMKFVNKIVNDKIEDVKIQCLDLIVLALDKTNVLMNALETPQNDSDAIQTAIKGLFTQLQQVYVVLMTLADLHNTEREQEKINRKNKGVSLFQITDKSISKLKKTIEKMAPYLDGNE